MRDLRMNKEQEEMFNNNIKFAYKMASEWSKEPYMPFNYQELTSYALEGLILAVKSYDVEKNDNFFAYSKVVMNNKKKRELQKVRKFNNELLTFNNDDIDRNENNSYNDEYLFEIQSQIKDYLKYCEPIDEYIFKEAILKKRSKIDVAKELNVSHMTVYNKINAMQQEIKNFITI